MTATASDDDFVIPLERLKTGDVGDGVLRKILAMGLEGQLRALDRGGVEAAAERHQAFVDTLRASPIAIETQAANDQHYEVPAAFYECVLGRHMKYSCGYWPEGVSGLDESEEAMLELVCRRAQLEDGQTVLDLGCGWGSMALFVAGRYPQSRVVALSNSATQRAYIESKRDRAGFTNLEVRTANFVSYDFSERFDRVVSIEMFEHLRNYDRAMGKVSSWLNPGGKLFLHVFTHLRHAYAFDGDNWIARHFFTGGVMPSDSLLLHFQNGLRIAQHWVVAGTHYQKTSEAWLERLDRHREQALAMLASSGAEDPLARFWMWRLFFLTCAESFGFRSGTQWAVSHYLFGKS